MKGLLFLFPTKVVGAFLLLLALTFVEVLFFATFYRGDLSFGTMSLLGAGIVFFAIQILFWSGLGKETIAVWDYVATLLGTVAALILVLGGVSYMGDAFRSDALPNIEDRLDDAIRVYADFQTDYCAAAPISSVAGSSDPPGGNEPAGPGDDAGDVSRAAPSTPVDPEIADMCERAKAISEKLALLDRPAVSVQISQIYHGSIETLPDHLRFSGNTRPSLEVSPISTFRTGTSLIALIYRLLAYEQRFSEGDGLLAVLRAATAGQYQFIWGLLLWNAASLKCGIILAKRRG